MYLFPKVHSCLGECKADLHHISTIQEEKNQRFKSATDEHIKQLKTMDVKLSVNKQQQDDLRQQLLKLEDQEKKLKVGHLDGNFSIYLPVQGNHDTLPVQQAPSKKKFQRGFLVNI